MAKMTQIDPGELKDAIDAYFDHCEEEQLFATITGLIRYLGFTSRKEFMDLGKRAKYRKTIDYAILRIEELYEKRASLLKNPSGPLFVLKHLGWEPASKKPEDEPVKGKGITVKIVRP